MSIKDKPSGHVFSVGNLPSGQVGLAWVEAPELTPDTVVVDNFGNLSQESTTDTLIKLYYADLDGTLKYNEPIETKEFVVTDRTINDVPLFYSSTSRFYHKDYNKYIDGSVYVGPSIKLLSLDNKDYPFAHKILLEVPTAYASSTGTEIPYRVHVEVESGAPFKLVYNKCDASGNNTYTAFQEHCFPYPIFIREDELSDVVPTGVDNYFIEDLRPNDFGYKVHVNAKAIIDPRQYQAFQWRVIGTAAGTEVVIPPTPTGIVLPPSGVPEPTGVTGAPPPTGIVVQPHPVAPKTIRACWYDWSESPDLMSNNGKIFEILTLIGKKANIPVNFINPHADDGLTQSSRNYWRLTKDKLRRLSDSELAQYDLIIITCDHGTLRFDQRIDQWDKLPGKALFLLISPGSRAADEWGFYTDSITGSISGNAETPRVTSIFRHIIDRFRSDPSYFDSITSSIIDEIFPSGNSSLWSVVSTIGSSGTTTGNAIAGVYENRKYVSTIGEHLMLLGELDASGRAATTLTHGWPSWMGASGPSGEYDISKYANSTAAPIQNSIAERLFSATMVMTNSASLVVSQQSPTVIPVTSDTTLVDNKYIVFSTPWVDSWVINGKSITEEEIYLDSSLVKEGDLLKRRLCKDTVKRYGTSFFYNEFGSAKKDWTISDMRIEINNPNVKLVSGLSDNSIPWVYTDAECGDPFIPGVGYPVGWKLLEPGYNRLYEKDDIDFPGWKLKQNSETIATPRKVWHPPVTDTETYTVEVPHTSSTTTPGTSTEVARTAAWQIGASQGGTASIIKWKVNGKQAKQTSSSKSFASKSYIQSITSKSFTVEANKNQAYAWQYLPNCDGLLKRGSTGTKVKYWQNILNKIGYNCGTADGNYGDKTAAAVLKFQQDHDEILDDSVIGPETGSRITYAAMNAGVTPGEWYDWASTWNCLPSEPGKYGRRTNPYDQAYYHGSLTDYLYVTMKATQQVTGIKLAGASLGGKGVRVTRVTAYNNTAGGTKVVDLTQGWQLYASEITIDFGGTKTVGQIYVHFEQTNPHDSVTTDGSTYYSYHWGLQYIDILGVDSGGATEIDAEKTGEVSLLPGETRDIVLPADTGVASETYRWTSCSITSGPGTVVFKPGSNNYAITITCTTAGGIAPTWGPEDSDTVKPSDGVKTRDFNSSFVSGLPGSIVDLLVKKTSACHSSVTVQFYDTSTKKFIGNSVTKSSFDSAAGRIKIGYKGGSTSSTPGETTTETTYETETRKRTIVVKEGYYETVYDYETRNWTTLEQDGLIDISSPDLPLIKMAIKPYWLNFYHGKRHIKLLPPFLNLESTDDWSPRITFAEWNQKIVLPESNLKSWMRYYPAAEIISYYRVPEDNFYQERYRKRFVNEKADIYGVYHIQLKRAPLFAGASTSGEIDLSITLDGTPVSSGNILDVDENGIVKLGVTTEGISEVRATYSIRAQEREIRAINMNPYPGHVLSSDGNNYTGWDKIGLPVYVYLLPEFCTQNNRIIPGSVVASPLQWTIDKRFFERDSSKYNPLAFLVGIVYSTMPYRYNDVIILDARKRGGGDPYTTLKTLWDIDYFNNRVYIESGVLVFELPESDRSKEQLIIKAIENNVAVGTLYKIRYT